MRARLGLLSLLTAAALLAAAPAAHAEWHGRGGWHGGGWHGPGPVVAGTLLGLGLGAVVAGALAPPVYAPPPPVVYAPPPVVYAPPPVLYAAPPPPPGYYYRW